jgi:hypothetical protein
VNKEESESVNENARRWKKRRKRERLDLENVL